MVKEVQEEMTVLMNTGELPGPAKGNFRAEKCSDWWETVAGVRQSKEWEEISALKDDSKKYPEEGVERKKKGWEKNNKSHRRQGKRQRTRPGQFYRSCNEVPSRRTKERTMQTQRRKRPWRTISKLAERVKKSGQFRKNHIRENGWEAKTMRRSYKWPEGAKRCTDLKGEILYWRLSPQRANQINKL